MRQSAHPRSLLTTPMETVTQSWEQEAASRRPPTRHLPLPPSLCLLWFVVHQWKYDDETDTCAYMYTWQAAPFDNLQYAVAYLAPGSLQSHMAVSVNKRAHGFSYRLLGHLSVSEKDWNFPTLNHYQSQIVQSEIAFSNKTTQKPPGDSSSWKSIARQTQFYGFINYFARKRGSQWITQMTVFLSWCHLLPLIRRTEKKSKLSLLLVDNVVLTWSMRQFLLRVVFIVKTSISR